MRVAFAQCRVFFIMPSVVTRRVAPAQEYVEVLSQKDSRTRSLQNKAQVCELTKVLKVYFS
jgi:hypothetical protein